MGRRRQPPAAPTGAEVLESLVRRAIDLAKMARRQRRSLSGDNYYGNRLLELRADATNAFRELSAQTAGDTSAMAEMMEAVFSPNTDRARRAQTAKDLLFSLRTTWRSTRGSSTSLAAEQVFPLTILDQTGRGYLTSIGRQMNGCFSSGWCDACAVMLRRLVEIALIEAFEAKGVAANIKDASGNYLQLSDLVSAALAEGSWTLSRNARSALPQLRDLGHRSAHGRYYHGRPEDIERVRDGARVVIEEFLHHAGLL